MSIQLKRAYDDPEESDGYRVLVDRLWPRGVNKEKLQLDEWARKIAPSDELRKWFDHDPEKFQDFNEKYISELQKREEEVAKLIEHVRREDVVTLIYGAKDREHNHARVIKEHLEKRLSRH